MSTTKDWLAVVQSVMAGLLGVQSQRKYVEDANATSFVPFVVVGVIMVIVLILSIWFGVSLLLPNT
ncbi:hypothetical protein GPUN_2827 [Glaciecola punicea ACAM 611]|jgi:hypothetical protein|uniref:DUF2970 domain-containing protein n=1 Tax=Glaciecola punicea ACAM 611 TaxID=1121923 RepID=H5TF14_9ALTE|nr:DUF2970 domain-containing protein [Glaciecola punicea]OFA32729.1 hypothetical protein BAE46_02940 [Glaciecola punicea]GAB56941.1 hypothetical protein GPUN_2827 [Glaciecola punicea ACAM 611]